MSLPDSAASALSILLVDDEPTLRLLLKKILAVHGNQIDEAADGTEGLEQYYKLRPDLIVLDVNLPYIDGITLLHEIRRQDAVVGIILVSALRYAAVADAIGSSRVDGYIEKPFRLALFRQEIQRVGELVRRRRTRGQGHH
jgi:DNA-binding response OmpR family regulator